MKSHAKAAKFFFIYFLFSVLLTYPIFAVDGLQISIRETNVVLTWPSVPGETYLVFFKRSLAETSKWEVLSAGLPAATATNVTSFVHYDQVPTNSFGSGGGGGQSSPPPVPGSFSAAEIQSKLMLRKSKPRPPLPWETKARSVTMDATSLQAQTAMLNPEPNCGFYQVKAVRLIAGPPNNSIVSGYGEIQVRPDVDVKYLRLVVNGNTYPGNDSYLEPPFTNTIAFEYIDWARLSNGMPCTLQIEGTWQLEDIHSEGLLTALSQPITVYPSNTICFPEWEDDADDQMASFYIQSQRPEVNWTIRVYNYYEYLNWYYGYTSNISPIKTITGATANGSIVYHWNMIDDYGLLRTNLQTDPYFFSFTTLSWAGLSPAGETTKPNPVQRQAAPYPQHGHWTVSYQDMFRHYFDENGRLISALTGWAAIADQLDVPPFIFYPTGNPTNAQTFPVRYNYGESHRLHSTNDIDVLMPYQDESLLTDAIRDPRSRNFYYSGHGNEQKIGKIISIGWLRDYGLRHRYRFVWLDGCQTGAGGWDRAFGINGPGIFSLSYYQERTKRPGVFIGNKYSVPLGRPGERNENGVQYDGTIPESVGFFASNVAFAWYLLGYPLADAIEYGQSTIPDARMFYFDGPKKGQRYQPGDDLYITGYDQLRFDEFNTRNDIPHP